MSARCQVQYLDPVRRTWVDCAKRTRTAVAVAGSFRDVCTDHREEVRRAERAGLADGLRWSEHPTRPRRQPSNPGQGQLVDVPATSRRRGWSA
jgi:hypothetical protein